MNRPSHFLKQSNINFKNKTINYGENYVILPLFLLSTNLPYFLDNSLVKPLLLTR